MNVTVTHDSEKVGFPLMGSRVMALVDGTDTNGRFELIELEIGPGGRSPLHTLACDKVFMVRRGPVHVEVDGRSVLGTDGTVVQVPAGAPHRYENPGTGTARMLVLTAGAGHVEFLAGMSRLTAEGDPDPDALAAHTAAHHVGLLAPTG